MFGNIKQKVVTVILRSLVAKYFDNLKILGYEINVVADKDSYKITAKLPKQSIDNLINKINFKG